MDLETAPNLAHVWSMWGENIPLDRLKESGYILCWTAKWLGEEKIYTGSRQKHNRKSMLSPIWDLLNEADAVVHYNGKKFDIPWLNSEFALEGFTPPSPYKQMDLLETVRSSFKFPSYKLAYVAPVLGLGKKIDTSYSLWDGCMKGDKSSWEDMLKYNVQDVILLEKLYNKLRPWIRSSVNYGLYSEDKEKCPRCGSGRFTRRGFAFTHANRYARFRCVDCGKWFRSNKPEDKPGKRYVEVI